MKTAGKDLIVLVADENMRFAIGGILGRCASLSIRTISYDHFTHPLRDPGCLNHSHEFLRSRVNQYAHALVVFDREGCGKDGRSRVELENAVEAQLSPTGWGQRAAAVVIDPELEMWVWSDSPHVDSALGWGGKQPDLRSWLRDRGMLEEGRVKPRRPKEAVEQALRAARRPRSSAIYAEIASRVGFERCTDGAFVKLRDVLRSWFR